MDRQNITLERVSFYPLTRTFPPWLDRSQYLLRRSIVHFHPRPDSHLHCRAPFRNAQGPPCSEANEFSRLNSTQLRSTEVMYHPDQRLESIERATASLIALSQPIPRPRLPHLSYLPRSQTRVLLDHSRRHSRSRTVLPANRR